MKLDYEYSIKSIRNSLKDATCRAIGKGIYSLNKQDTVIESITRFLTLHGASSRGFFVRRTMPIVS